MLDRHIGLAIIIFPEEETGRSELSELQVFLGPGGFHC